MKVQEPREEHIRRTVEASKRAFYESLERKEAAWPEFLAGQFRFIRKRWWLFQFLILVILWAVMYLGDSEVVSRREAAVLMPAFALLMLPELWKNVHNNSTEVENAACFTMRQIYAARLTMFALTDLLLLTVFFTVTTWTLQRPLLDLIVQLLIPLNVTSCICLGTLCVKRFRSEYAAAGFCIIWTGIWYWIVGNEMLYSAISGAAWAGLLLLSSGGLLLTVRQLLKTCQKYTEDQLLWN